MVNIERGRHRIQIHVLYAIAQVLGVEPHDLLPPLLGDDGTALPSSFMKLLLPKEQAAVKRLVTRSGGSTS